MSSPQEFIDSYTSAFQSGDSAALLALYADEFRAFDALDEVEFQDKDAWQGRTEAWFTEFGGERKCEFHDVDVLESGDLVVVVATLVLGGDVDGIDETVELEFRGTFVLGRFDDELLVVHEHVSVPMAIGELDEDHDHDDDDVFDGDDDGDDDAESDDTGGGSGAKVLGDQEDLDVEGQGHRGGLGDDRTSEARNQ